MIVPIYNVEPYLDHCLRSILRQDFRDFEVVVVDDGSPDRSYDIAKAYAREDDRIRIIRRPNGGLGAARNTGIRRARGRYLMFVDSDDAVPQGAVGAMVRSARRSGSDIVVGSAVRFDGSRRWTPEWVHELHAKNRIGITLEEFPALLRNNYTWNKLFRRSFWKTQGLWFREGVSYEDQPIVAELLSRARTIDVLARPTYEYRARADGSSISQQTSSLSDLRDRIQAWHVTRDALKPTASPALYEAWLQTLFDAHFHWYLNSPAIVSRDYWEMLQEAVADFAAEATPAVWHRTMPMRRVMIELACRDKQLEARDFIHRNGHRMHNFPSLQTADGLWLQLPYFDDPALGLDRELFLLRPEQLELSHSVQSLRWLDDGHLELTGWAYIRYLDLSKAPQGSNEVTLVVRHRRSGTEHVFADRHQPEPPFPAPNDDPWADYSGGHFAFRVPFADLCVEVGASAGDIWDLSLKVDSGGIKVSAPVTRVNQRGSAASLEHAACPDGLLVVLWQWRRPLRIRLDAVEVELVDAVVKDRVVTGVLLGRVSEVAHLQATAGGTVTTSAPAISAGEHRAFVSLSLPAPAEGALSRPSAAVRWRVRAVLTNGTRLPVAWRPGDPIRQVGRGQVVALEQTRFGRVTIVERRGEIIVEQIHADEPGVLTVSGSFHGAISSPFLVGAVHPTRRSDFAVPEIDGDRFRVSLPIARTEGRFGSLPLRAGEYRLLARTAGEQGEEFPVHMSKDVQLGTPVSVGSDAVKAVVVTATGSAVQLSIARPLGDARGRYRQNIFRTRRPAGTATRPGVLLQSYFGESATDNGVGLQAELRRRGVDLPVYWAVRDYSVPVPEGGIPVIKDSAEWHDVLSSVTYYMDNMYQPDYHHKPEGQVMIETFHGYPFKTMGMPNWLRAGFSTERIDSYARRSAEWDYLVSPATYATPLLRRDFRYDGPVLEIGYPRNDLLSDPGSEVIRQRVRDAFGIKPDQTVVLYAPTYRDYLSPDDHRAEMVDFLDLDAVTAALGEDFVVLVRGHAFNARVNRRTKARPGVLDVTDYPEITDLYLAADAAIVDYSSLRFDFGVTGKPMIFHVPDLERYVETRGWLFDFEPTAPGPFVNTNDEVIDALARLDAVRTDYAEQYRRFREDYLSLEDGHASARLVDAVFVPRGDAPAAAW